MHDPQQEALLGQKNFPFVDAEMHLVDELRVLCDKLTKLSWGWRASVSFDESPRLTETDAKIRVIKQVFDHFAGRSHYRFHDFPEVAFRQVSQSAD